MEVNGLSNSIERSKKRACLEEEEDMLSKLPESILTQILSLLPTKEALRTCVLSKSWINRWKSITSLQFDDSDAHNYFPFCDFCKTSDFGICVEYAKYGSTMCLACERKGEYAKALSDSPVKRILIHYESRLKVYSGQEEEEVEESFVNFLDSPLVVPSINTPTLESFSIVVYKDRDESLSNCWISGLLNNRRVKNLRIHSYFHKIPFTSLTCHYIFNSSWLQELELLLKLVSTIHVPTTTSLNFEGPKLLNLHGIFFNIDPSVEFFNLNLPVVKKFKIKNCLWSNGKDAIVEAPLLETLSFEHDTALNCWFLDIQDTTTQSIKFNSFNLKEFNYSGSGTKAQKVLPSHDSSKISLIKVKKKDFRNKSVTFYPTPFPPITSSQMHQI